LRQKLFKAGHSMLSLASVVDFELIGRLAMASSAELNPEKPDQLKQRAVNSSLGSSSLGATNRHAAWMKLASEVQRLEGGSRNTEHLDVVSTGCCSMDACLPAGGYAPGSIIEYLRSTEGCGASYLAMTAAASALRKAEDKYLVVVDPDRRFYPPALLNHQIDLQRVIWVHPQSTTDAIWAMDQALRTASVAAVIADIDMLDDRSSRRLQLAAQRGGGLGLLLRGLSARRAPSWAEVQWVVRSVVPQLVAEANSADQTNSAARTTAAVDSGDAWPMMRRLEVVLARMRGGKAGARLLLDIDSVHGRIHCVSMDKSRSALSGLHIETTVKGRTATAVPAAEVMGAQPAKRQVKAS
jgi:protein ImuA